MAATSKPLRILITGCSAGGIGSTLAQSLASRGHHVFATLRNTSKLSLELSSRSNVTVLELDVTAATSIAAAVKVVEEITEGKGLDILVNNAGTGYTMPLLDSDLEEGKRLFETNMWGLLAVTKAFMDLLIQARGTVVNISSVGGEVNTPWIGIYAASKAAVTVLSETLRLEVAPLGVHVQTVMVGVITTPFWANEPAFFLPQTSRYHAIKDTIAKCASGEAVPKGISPEVFAKQIVSDVLSRKSGQFYRGPMSSTVGFCSRYLPKFVVDSLISNGQGLGELAESFKTSKQEARISSSAST
ncbi:oxidoreductase [Lindgomyces ingoldianus]|uniref:Oxidoreductase n=1 Tax=Lindgomyces ingoldianus TaxID=673940 RepID=A0ACB6RCE5_9PLEO|nr:oxidoreductase [Lindgomyces ingoldianus]KAF2476762.1 oxidoreductase [Lindgomyces ingoldianus]